MKFRCYITDLFDGCIRGANSPAVADTCAKSEDYFVVDTETGEWVTDEGNKAIDGIE